jgi:hypothetical protein
MPDDALTRRAFWTVAAGSAGLAMAGASANPLREYLRAFASCAAGEVWHAYGGVIEIAAPEQPIVPLCGVQTLIRRAVQPGRAASNTGPDEYAVTTWEGNYYHGLDDLAPRAELVNPATGARVQPMHFREGRRITHFTVDRLRPFVADGIESRIEWRSAGPYTWLRRQLHIDVPHPLDPQRWRLESSGARNRSGSFSTHCVLNRDLQNPRLSTVPGSFEYQAIFGWLPWMLMGQRPGHLIWRAHGLKLPSIEMLDPAVRRGFESVFPALLSPAEPWNDSTSLWDDYRRNRSPAAQSPD